MVQLVDFYVGHLAILHQNTIISNYYYYVIT